MARNTAIDYLRFGRGAKGIDVSTRSSPFPDWILNLDRVLILHGALEKLTATQRLVLNLAFVEGMSQAEIARNLNRPLGTIKTWMRTALRLLYAELQPSYIVLMRI